MASPTAHSEVSTLSVTAAERELCTSVLAAVRDIRFGSVQLLIHDGKVVEIQKVERIRPDARCQS